MDFFAAKSFIRMCLVSYLSIKKFDRTASTAQAIVCIEHMQKFPILLTFSKQYSMKRIARAVHIYSDFIWCAKLYPIKR